MAKRENHYERAFQRYLRVERIPYVSVNESRRSLCGDRSLKSVDFLVSPVVSDYSYIIDIKGRQFPSGRQKQYFKNWTTEDDLTSLARWETVFGPRFRGLFVFAYNVVGDQAPLPADQLFSFEDHLYGFVAIRLDLYVGWSRPLSPRWKTVAMPTARFRELAVPVGQFFQEATYSGISAADRR